jgi:hypothetical protein
VIASAIATMTAPVLLRTGFSSTWSVMVPFLSLCDPLKLAGLAHRRLKRGG